MPVYNYKATALDGKITKGKGAADNERELYRQLRLSNLYLTECKEVESENIKVKLKSKELAEFMHQIGTMLASGISITRCMSIIVSRTEKKKLKEVYSNINSLIQQGIVLSDAMQQQGDVFPVLMINMIRAGENSGQLESVAFKLSEHYEKDNRLQAKVRSAMMYPLFLLVLVLVIVVVLFTMVLPSFFELFAGMTLPWYTQAIISLSKLLTQKWMACLITVLIVVLAFKVITSNPKVKEKLDFVKIKLPLVGKLLTTIYTARFARNLSSLYASGLSMIQSLQICQGLIGTSYIEKQFPDAIYDVKNGVPLSNAVAQINGFDPKLASSIFVGEETGRIDEILNNMADSFDYDADQATTRLTTLLEPLMIVVMAAVVGFIMLAVMVPIYGMYNNIG